MGRLERMDASLSVASIMLNPELDITKASKAPQQAPTPAPSNANSIDSNSNMIAGVAQKSGTDGNANANAKSLSSFSLNPMYAKELFMSFPAKGAQPAGNLPLSDYVWISS